MKSCSLCAESLSYEEHASRSMTIQQRQELLHVHDEEDSGMVQESEDKLVRGLVRPDHS